MYSSDTCVVYLFLAISIGFTVFIYFLLKWRKSFLAKNLKLTSDHVWESISAQTKNLNLQKSNLLFAIPQDASLSTVCTIVKDTNNQILSQVLKPMAERQQTFSIKDENFLIKFLLTWNRTAILISANGEQVFAQYRRTSWLGRHEYEVPGYGLLKSERPSFNFKVTYNYRLNGELVGTSEMISTRREIGRLIVLPDEIPLPVRIFILTVF